MKRITNLSTVQQSFLDLHKSKIRRRQHEITKEITKFELSKFFRVKTRCGSDFRESKLAEDSRRIEALENHRGIKRLEELKPSQSTSHRRLKTINELKGFTDAETNDRRYKIFFLFFVFALCVVQKGSDFRKRIWKQGRNDENRKRKENKPFEMDGFLIFFSLIFFLFIFELNYNHFCSQKAIYCDRQRYCAIFVFFGWKLNSLCALDLCTTVSVHIYTINFNCCSEIIWIFFPFCFVLISIHS